MKSKLLILIIWFYGILSLAAIYEIADIEAWLFVVGVLVWSFIWVMVFKKLN